MYFGTLASNSVQGSVWPHWNVLLKIELKLERVDSISKQGTSLLVSQFLITHHGLYQSMKSPLHTSVVSMYKNIQCRLRLLRASSFSAPTNILCCLVFERWPRIAEKLWCHHCLLDFPPFPFFSSRFFWNSFLLSVSPQNEFVFS